MTVQGVDGVADLIRYITERVVDHPEDVVVEVQASEAATMYRVLVHPADHGQAIGKEGRIAQAIRTIAKASAMREGLRAYVEVDGGLADRATTRTGQV